jgi:16S rRNA processing protein RimM
VCSSRLAPDAVRWVTVGRVGRRHGLEGAFVVEEPSAAPERFAPGARVYIDRQPALVAESKRAGSRLVVRLDRPASRGARLELPADELPPPEEDSYYVFELVGLVVEEEGGTRLGRVREVAPGVADDVLLLDTGIALPLVGDCVREVDVGDGRIVVAPGFTEQS